jgi:hypothetical protein
VADIFVSYTSKDRDWAFWIGQELEKLGHVAHIDAWEISGGGDIAAWMDEQHDKADHILLVISDAYLDKPYSSWERRSAQWAAQTDVRILRYQSELKIAGFLLYWHQSNIATSSGSTNPKRERALLSF